MPLANHSIMSKKFNAVVKTPSTSKYINHWRFYSHRENSAKKWEVAAVVVVEATVVAGAYFIVRRVCN